jgi:putative ABC transport system permease protein
LATYVFPFELAFNPWIFVVGAVAGAVIALLGGWLGLRQVLNSPPLATLRGV